MQLIDNINVIKLYETIETQHNYYLIIDYCS